MSLLYNKKIQVTFTKEDEWILDGQSRICNWLYNHLLDACIKDYKENHNSKQLLSDRNLRDYGVSLKEQHPFLKTVFSSVLKEPANRLSNAYQKFFDKKGGYPKFRSWKKKWFSLVFDEPNKGWELLNHGTSISVSLGNIPGMKKEKGKRNPSIIGKLNEKFKLQENEIIKTFMLTKQQGNKFYGIFTVERCTPKELKFKQDMSIYRKEVHAAKKENREMPIKPTLESDEKEIPKNVKWISLDPNHKNFFVGVDHKGNSVELQKLRMIPYWDKKIDELKSLRDVCEKTYRKKKTKHGNTYTVHSPRWNRINHALDKAYHTRREQIKTCLYSIAHELYRNYDLIMIGDYTPTNGTAPFKNMKRSMLNQEKIGEFRRIVKWVAEKLGNHFLLVNERNTTKECCVCGHKEKKEPNLRIFTCISCQTTIMRDSNAAVNIAKKVGYFLDLNKYKEKLKCFTHKGEAVFNKKVTLTIPYY